jgi:hypothetical protein
VTRFLAPCPGKCEETVGQGGGSGSSPERRGTWEGGGGGVSGRRRRSGGPHRSMPIPVAPGRQGNREGHADSAAKRSEMGLTEKGENGGGSFDFGGDDVSPMAGVD